MKSRLVMRLRRWLQRIGMTLPFLVLGGCGHSCGHLGGHGGHLFDGSHLNRGANKINQCATITAGSMPEPPGMFVARHIKVQAEKAEADDFTIHLNEWFQGGKDLGPYGRYHLDQIARRWGETPFPVVIATSESPELDLLRRKLVVDQLGRKGIPDADIRVVLGYPQAEGLFGDEMEPAYIRMLTAPSFGLFGNPYQGFGGGFGLSPAFGGFFGGGLFR